MSTLKNFFSSRLGIFLSMLLLASISWVYVTAAQNRIDAFPGKIPISLKNGADDLVSIIEAETIEVRIQADQRSWSLLSVDSFTAYVDLKDLGVGVHELPVNVAVSIPNVRIVEKNPSVIRIRLEELVTKDVPVRVVVQGKPAEGKAPGDPIATPNRALVMGAKSIVAAITDAQATVTLGGESTDVVRTVKVQAHGKEGEPLGNIRFEPSSVGVRVPIVQASNAKTVGVRVVTTGSPKEGFYVQKIVFVPTTLTITGGGDISSVETKPIDLTNLSSDKAIEVDLVLPTGTKIVEGSNRATVTLILAPLPTSKRVPLTFTFSDIDPALKVTSVDPASGNVVITGPTDIVSGINSVTAVISLSGKGEGMHQMNLVTDLIQTPNGTTVSGTPTPSSISVTLSKK